MKHVHEGASYKSWGTYGPKGIMLFRW